MRTAQEKGFNGDSQWEGSGWQVVQKLKEAFERDTGYSSREKLTLFKETEALPCTYLLNPLSLSLDSLPLESTWGLGFRKVS